MMKENGFKSVGGLVRGLSFNSTIRRSLGALQIINESQLVVDKWAKGKFGKNYFPIKVVLYKEKILFLGVEQVFLKGELEAVVRGLRLALNRELGAGFVKEIRVRISS